LLLLAQSYGQVNTKVHIQVIQHMDAGMTVVEACRAVGMPRNSFNFNRGGS